MSRNAATSTTSAPCPVPLWRLLLVFLLLITTVFLIGALLAYPLFLCLAPFSGIGFHKVLHYAIVLTGLALCLYYLHATRKLSVMFGAGLGHRANLKTLGLGFATGAAVLLLVELCVAVLGMRQPDPDLANGTPALLLAVLRALLAGITVAVSEEVIYRGAIYTGLARYRTPFAALFISALFYSAVHFIDIQPLPAGTAVTWLTGPTQLAGAFYQFTDPFILDALFSLILLGIFFGLLRRYTGNLIMCIGAHAGIVAINKIISYITDYQAGTPYAYLVNAYDHQTGLLASCWLALACLICWLGSGRNKGTQ